MIRHLVRLLGVAIVVVAVTACVPDVPAPVVTTTTPPAVQAIEEARDVLAEPVIDLAGGILDIARRVDFIRHEVARGDAMAAAIADLGLVQEALAGQADELDAAVSGMEGVLAPAKEAVGALVALSRRIGQQAAEDGVKARDVLEVDGRIAALIDGWDGRGSRSESADRFDVLLAEANAVVAQARALALRPAACGIPRLNRIRWAELVRSRTIQLRDLAVSADGLAYDELRERFDHAPFGEDRVAADAESRACWAQRSPLPRVPPLVEEHLAAVEQALGGGA